MTTKQQAQHTPGPWSIGGRNIIIGHTPLLVEIATVNDGGLDLDDSDNEAAAAVVTANARLIAAAPDLLSALAALTTQAHRMNNRQHAGLDLRAEDWAWLYSLAQDADTAIRKAKGEA